MKTADYHLYIMKFDSDSDSDSETNVNSVDSIQKRSFTFVLDEFDDRDPVSIQCVEHSSDKLIRLSVQLDEYEEFVGEVPYTDNSGLNFDQFRELIINTPDDKLCLSHARFGGVLRSGCGFMEYVILAIGYEAPEDDSEELDIPEIQIQLSRELSYDMLRHVCAELACARRKIMHLRFRLERLEQLSGPEDLENTNM